MDEQKVVYQETLVYQWLFHVKWIYVSQREPYNIVLNTTI